MSLCPLLAHAVTIDLVAVGNPGNSADGEGGPGAVASSYSISKYEITIGQYVEFLNAVAVTDANGQPTTGAQTAGTTEDGAYLIGATVTRRTTNPNTGAAPTYALPTADQWYKAAYYDPTLNSGTGGYYASATQSSTSPGNTVGPDPNQANVVVGGEYSLTQSSELVGAQNSLTDVGSYSGGSSLAPLADIPDGERRDGPPEPVIRRKHPVIAMPVLLRRRDEVRQTIEELGAA